MAAALKIHRPSAQFRIAATIVVHLQRRRSSVTFYLAYDPDSDLWDCDTFPGNAPASQNEDGEAFVDEDENEGGDEAPWQEFRNDMVDFGCHGLEHV
jgi:hypothetical protein